MHLKSQGLCHSCLNTHGTEIICFAVNSTVSEDWNETIQNNVKTQVTRKNIFKYNSLNLNWYRIFGASFPRCECVITGRTSAAPVWLQGASPQVLLCQSSYEKLAMQRGTLHKKARKMKQWQRILQSKPEAAGIYMVSCYLPDQACCTIPACTPLLPAEKRSTKWGTPEWCFPCDGLQGSFWSTFFNSLLTFLTLTRCTAWGAFGTQR